MVAHSPEFAGAALQVEAFDIVQVIGPYVGVDFQKLSLVTFE